MQKQKGFTLIELLVVVLIIGILATIAVSAYQKAVLKSRFSSLMPIAKTLAQGNEDYYLRNGQYADDVSKLDIKAVGNDKTQITLSDEDNHKYVLLTRDDMNNQLRMYQQKSKNFPGETHCEALVDNDQANWLCRDALHGTFVGNKFGYTIYSLSEEVVGNLGRNYYNQNEKIWEGNDVCVGTVRWGCSDSTVTSGSKCKANARDACMNSTFEPGSICEANDYLTCGYSSFTNATCAANYESSCRGGNFTNQSVCQDGGNGGSCANSSFTNSTCIADGGFSCNDSTFTNNSSCMATAYRGCQSSTFTNSTCTAKVWMSCVGNTFDVGSVCYANAPNTCEGTYQGGCCSGKYCPSSAPSCPEE